VRHVHRDELHVAVHEIGDEGHVTGQTMQSGEEKHGAAPAAFSYGRKQLGPVGVLLAALDLDELRGVSFICQLTE
jgi:hypothetical protein